MGAIYSNAGFQLGTKNTKLVFIQKIWQVILAFFNPEKATKVRMAQLFVPGNVLEQHQPPRQPGEPYHLKSDKILMRVEEVHCAGAMLVDLFGRVYQLDWIDYRTGKIRKGYDKNWKLAGNVERKLFNISKEFQLS